MTGSAIVVGGGLIGCSSALYLSRLGWEVTLIESGSVGGGCSHGNCGYLCPSHVLPLAVPGAVGKALRAMARGASAITIAPRFDPTLWRWLLRFWRQCRPELAERSAQGRHALLSSSRALYAQLLAEEEIEVELDERGLLLVFKTEKEFEAHGKTARWLGDEFGIATRGCVGTDLRELEPALVPGLGGGWLYEDDAHMHPERVIDGLRAVAERGGVAFVEATTVTDFRIEGGRARAVVTASGGIDADCIVLATGAEVSHLSRRLGLELPVQPGKGYSITLPVPKRVPKIPMVFEEQHVAVTPFRDSFRIGSTMEFAGFDRTLPPERLALLRRSAAEHLIDPGSGPAIEEWCGWRPMTPDDLPFIGPVPAVENVFVAAGNGMIGLSSAPATGKLLAELASGVTPHVDPTPYALDRFAR